MKKWFAVLGSVVGVLLLTAVVAGTVFAQGPVADSDGVNDRYGTNPEFVDEDGDELCGIHGIAPGEGTAQGYARWFRAENDAPQTPMTRRGGFGRRVAAQSLSLSEPRLGINLGSERS